MQDWLRILALLLAGFLLLWRGADWLVAGSSLIARRFGISTLVVALTVVAFGTSAPEIIVSALAASEGKVDLSLGNVLGSNIANIGLVLGACAVVLPTVMETKLSLRETLWLFLSLTAFYLVAQDRSITRLEGGLLLVLFCAYNAHVLLTAGADLASEDVDERRGQHPWFWTLLGMAAILSAAKLVVLGAEEGALRLGVPKSVVGLTVVAIGTSLPELAAGLGGAFRGQKDISLGNVIGSNVFNVLAVIGIVALVQPISAALLPESSEEIESAFDLALSEDVWVVFAFSAAAFLLPRISIPGLSSKVGGRLKGALLLAAYVGYSVWLFATRVT